MTKFLDSSTCFIVCCIEETALFANNEVASDFTEHDETWLELGSVEISWCDFGKLSKFKLNFLGIKFSF